MKALWERLQPRQTSRPEHTPVAAEAAPTAPSLPRRATTVAAPVAAEAAPTAPSLPRRATTNATPVAAEAAPTAPSLPRRATTNATPVAAEAAPTAPSLPRRATTNATPVAAEAAPTAPSPLRRATTVAAPVAAEAARTAPSPPQAAATLAAPRRCGSGFSRDGLGLALALIAASPTAFAASLDLGDSNIARGGYATVTATIPHEGQVSAIQFDMDLPGGVAAPGIALRTPTLPMGVITHRVTSDERSAGKLRVIVISDRNAILPNPAIVELRFSSTITAPVGTVPLALSNVVFSTAAGTGVTPTATTGGTLTVTSIIDPILIDGFESP
jgi:hypothetical protein